MLQDKVKNERLSDSFLEDRWNDASKAIQRELICLPVLPLLKGDESFHLGANTLDAQDDCLSKQKQFDSTKKRLGC